MEFLFRIECDSYSLALARFDESEEVLLDDFVAYRDRYEEEIRGYGASKRRLEYLCTRRLLKELLQQEVWVSHAEDGRPYLDGFPFQLSISHAANYVAVMLGKTLPVGVDVELKREKLFRIQYKFLTEEESSWVDSCPDKEDRLSALLLLWCAKEAVFKRYERPLPEFSEEIAVKPFVIGQSEGGLSVVADLNGGKTPISLEYKMFGDIALVYTIS